MSKSNNDLWEQQKRTAPTVAGMGAGGTIEVLDLTGNKPTTETKALPPNPNPIEHIDLTNAPPSPIKTGSPDTETKCASMNLKDVKVRDDFISCSIYI